MHVNSKGALNSWVSSRARQLTKDHQNLGTCSPRETHLKEPTSTHKLSSYVLLVGAPIRPNAGKQVQASRRQPREGNASTRELTPSPRPKRLSRELTPSPRPKRLSRKAMPREAKSKHLVKFSLRWFCPSNLFFSLLCLMGCLRVKGEPQASRLAGSYFSRPHAPSGLVEP